jgi:hypothetical protein
MTTQMLVQVRLLPLLLPKQSREGTVALAALC